MTPANEPRVRARRWCPTTFVSPLELGRARAVVLQHQGPDGLRLPFGSSRRSRSFFILRAAVRWRVEACPRGCRIPNKSDTTTCGTTTPWVKRQRHNPTDRCSLSWSSIAAQDARQDELHDTEWSTTFGKRGAPSNKGMKLTKLSAAPTLAPQAALGRRCRRMPAPPRSHAGTASQLIPGVRQTW